MKRQRVIIMLVGLLFLAVSVAMVSGDQGLMTFYRTWRQMRQLQVDLASSRKTVDSLIIEVERLKNDTTHIERIAREKYGMARKNEKMYKFIEEKE